MQKFLKLYQHLDVSRMTRSLIDISKKKDVSSDHSVVLLLHYCEIPAGSAVRTREVYAGYSPPKIATVYQLFLNLDPLSPDFEKLFFYDGSQYRTSPYWSDYIKESLA